ncbi:MAG: O-antigen ligase family protein [Candidatus Korobacteraceae bacterium]
MQSQSASLDFPVNVPGPTREASGVTSAWDPDDDLNQPPAPAPREKRWDLAFFGIMLYVLVEYSRLPAMYPVLAVLNLGKVALVSALLGLLFSSKPTTTVRSGIGHIDGIYVWLLVACFASALMAEFAGLAFGGALEAVMWVIIYVLISRIVNTPWRLRTVVFLFLLLNLKLGQFVVRGYSQGSAGASDQMVFIANGVGGGSTGFFANSADLGVAMCVAWPIAVALLFSRPKFFTKGLVWGCTFACLGAILLCGSRGAVVGAAGIALGAWLKAPKKIIALFLIILLVAGIYLVLPEASKKRFESAKTPESDKTAKHRIELWKAGLRIFADHPVLGIGIHNYRWVRFYDYWIPILNDLATVPHNSFITGISELGLLGFLPFIMLWISFFRLNSSTRKILIRAGPEARRSYEYCFSVGLDMGMIGYLASGTFVSVLWYPHIFVLTGLAAATHQIVLAEQAKASSQPEETPVRQVA